MYLSDEVIVIIIAAASLLVILGGTMFAGFALVIRHMNKHFDHMDKRFDQYG